MPTLLKIGADVTGAEKVERLAKDLREAANATDSLAKSSQKGNAEFKTMSSVMGGLAKESEKLVGSISQTKAVLAGFKTSLDSIWSSSSVNVGLKEFQTSIKEVGRDLSYSRQQLSDFITTSGQYATLAQANAKATHATSVALRAEEAAMNSLLRIEGNYVDAKAKELLLTDKAAIALTTETAAVNAQIAAYQKLNASGKMGNYEKGFDYVATLKAENASIAAQEKGLKELEVQFRKTAEARAALKQGSYAAEIAAENASIAAQERGLEELEAQFRKTAAARAALKQGSYVAKESTSTSFSNIDVESVAKYDVVTKKLLNAKEVMAAFDTQMNKTATVSKGFFASLIDGFPTLSEIGSGFDDLTKRGGKLHDTFRGMSGAAGQLWLTYGQMAPMIAGFAAISGTMKTISTGINFDFATRSFQDLAEGADKSAVGLQNIQKELLAMSNLTSGPGELAAGLLEFARAGISAEEAMQGIAEVSRFAYLGEMDMAKATEIVVGQLTAFKNIDTGKALNIMALVADKTSISLNQMSEAFKNTTSLGTVLGVSFDDVAVAIGAMGQAGIRGATAGAALTTMMYKLTAPTAAVEKKMRELGVSFSAINKNTGGLKTIEKIIKDLAAATKGLAEGQKGELFESMVGLRGLKALGALVDVAKEGTVEFEKMRVKVKAIFNEGGGRNSYLEQRFNNLTKSGKVQLDILKAELDKLFISSYNNSQTVEALEKLTKIVSDPQIKEGLASIVSGVISVSSTLVSFTNTFGGVLLTGYLGKIIFGKITAWTAAAGEAAAAIGIVNAATLTMVSAAAWTPWLVAIGMAVKSMWDLAEATNRVAIERAAINKTPLSDAANTFLGGDLGVGGDLVVLQQEVIQGQEDFNDSLKATKGYISGIIGVSKELSEEEEKRFDAATDFLNKLEEQTNQLYKTPIEVIRDEQVQALDDFSTRMAGIRESFDATEEGQRNFNNRLEKGKETINKFYDGKLLKALDSEISGMETAWKNHFLSVLSGYEEMLDKQKDLSSRKGVITTLLESSDSGQVSIDLGLPTQNPWESTIEQAKSAGKSISEEFAETVTPTIDTLKLSLVEVNAELEKSGSQARNVVAQAAYYKEWEKSLSGVALATKDFIESKLAFSKSAAEDQGLSNLIATAEEQKKAIISLGKAETDLYQGTVISKKAYEDSTEAVKAKIRAIVEESEANATLAKGAALIDARMENAVARYKKLNESDAAYLSEQKANADEGLRILEEDYKQKKILDTEYAKDRNTIITNTLKDELDAKKLALMRAQKLVEEFASSSEGGETELSVKQIALLKDQEVALREVAEAESNLRKEQLRTGSEVASMTLERTTSILLAESQLAAAYGKTYEASVKQLEAEKVGLQNGKDRVTLIKEEIIELKKRQAANDYEQEMLRAQAELLNLKGEIYLEDSLIYEATMKQLEADQLSLQYGDEKLNAIKLQVIELKKLEAATKTPYEAMQKGMKEAVYSGKEMAEDIQRATENAFDSMTDAIVDFVKTGKMNFSDLTDSILTDLLTIMVRANVTNTILSALGVSSTGTLTSSTVSGAAAASGMNVGGLGGLFNSGSTIAGGAASLLSGWGSDLAFSDSAFSGLSSTLFDVSDLLSQNLTVGSGILAGVGSLSLSLFSGEGINAQSASQAGGAALGTILTAGSPIGGVLGGIVGSLVGGMFGTGEDTFGPQYMANDVGVNYNLTSGMTPTTKQYTGGDTDSQIAKVYAEQMRSIQVAFDDQVKALAEALPDEISSAMLASLSSANLKQILNNVSGQEINVSDAESWLKGVAEAYSSGLMQELGKAYGTALSSFISTNGAEGLVGSSEVWSVLTDAVKSNIETTFQEAAATIAAGDIETGVANINSITSAIATIGAAMEPIQEIIDTKGMSDYTLGLREINNQFDTYDSALKAAGVDLDKFTASSEARNITINKYIESFLEPFTELMAEVDTTGLTEYGQSISDINDQYVKMLELLTQAGLGDLGTDQRSQLDAWKVAKENVLKSTTISEALSDMETDIKNSGLTELQVSIQELGKQAQDTKDIITEASASTEQIAVVNTWLSNQLSDLLSGIMDPIREANANFGLTDLEISLNQIASDFDTLTKSLADLGNATPDDFESIKTDAENKKAELFKPTFDTVEDIIADSALTDFGKSMAAVKEQFEGEDGILTTLIKGGYDLTEANLAYALSIKKVQDAVKDPIMQDVSTIIKNEGLSDFIISLNSLDEKFNTYAATVTEAGGSLQDMVDIEKARLIEVTKVYADLKKELLAEILTAANNLLNEATTNLNASFSKAQEDLTKQYEANAGRLNDELDTAKESVSAMKSLTDSFKSALNSMELETEQFKTNQMMGAQSELKNALAAARAGNFEPAKNLDSAVSTLTSTTPDMFGSAEEYQRNFWTSFAGISELEGLTGSRLSIEEQSVATLEAQLEANTVWYDQQKDILTTQLEAILGTKEAILSLSEATSAYYSAFNAQVVAANSVETANTASEVSDRAKQLKAAEEAVILATSNLEIATKAKESAEGSLGLAEEANKVSSLFASSVNTALDSYQLAFGLTAVDVTDIEDYSKKTLDIFKDVEKFLEGWKSADVGGYNYAATQRDLILSGINSATSAVYGIRGSVVGAINSMSAIMQERLSTTASYTNSSTGAVRVDGSFAVGANYIPYDMVAQLHEGETVVPAAYSRSDTTNTEIVNELRSLKTGLMAVALETAKNTNKMASLLDVWDGDGMPEVRVL